MGIQPAICCRRSHTSENIHMVGTGVAVQHEVQNGALGVHAAAWRRPLGPRVDPRLHAAELPAALGGCGAGVCKVGAVSSVPAQQLLHDWQSSAILGGLAAAPCSQIPPSPYHKDPHLIRHPGCGSPAAAARRPPLAPASCHLAPCRPSPEAVWQCRCPQAGRRGSTLRGRAAARAAWRAAVGAGAAARTGRSAGPH